jgi:hypothetical protein
LPKKIGFISEYIWGRLFSKIRGAGDLHKEVEFKVRGPIFGDIIGFRCCLLKFFRVFGLLYSIGWLSIDISGQPVCSIFKDPVSNCFINPRSAITQKTKEFSSRVSFIALDEKYLPIVTK